MNHYVVYHCPRPDKMNCRVTEMDAFTAYTDKPVSIDTVGGRLSLITGERISVGISVRFYLRSSFIIASIGQSDRKGFRSKMKGSEGKSWDDPLPQLDGEGWFPDFKKTQFFSHGFSVIRNPMFISGLERVLHRGSSGGK